MHRPSTPTLHILLRLSEGASPDEILRETPTLTRDHIAAAAAEAILALTTAPRIETRAERIARLQETHPRAYEPWREDEDERLLARWADGVRLADLARGLGRPPGAIRARLERHLGEHWRTRPAKAPSAPGPVDGS